MDEWMNRLVAGKGTVADMRRAVDDIETLCAALDEAEAERKATVARLEKAVAKLIWIANGGEGATVDDLRYAAEMAVAEITA